MSKCSLIVRGGAAGLQNRNKQKREDTENINDCFRSDPRRGSFQLGAVRDYITANLLAKIVNRLISRADAHEIRGCASYDPMFEE